MASPRYLSLLYAICALWPASNAQTCYYPNGNVASNERPCSSAAGSACCPDKWACLDNGLCYYDVSKLYGRYSCTDRSWNSPGCPSNMCVYDTSRGGGEAVAQCSNQNNQWCCDGDRTNVDCCNGRPSPRAFFDLAGGNQYALIGSSTASSTVTLATINGPLSGGSSPSSSPAPASTTSPSNVASSITSRAASSSANPSSTIAQEATSLQTSVQTEVSTGSAGPVTIVRTITAAAATSTSDSAAGSSSSSSNVPIIVGCAVGIPLGIALLALLFILFRKRSQKKNASTPDDPWDSTGPKAGAAKLRNEKASPYHHDTLPDVPELPGQTIGPERPISLLQGKAELEGGTGFAPGTFAHSPHLVGVGGGTNAAPPGYSTPNTPRTPAANSNFSHVHNASATSLQKPLQHGAGVQQYVAYRPPPGHEATTQPAELSATAKTPPAAEEKR